MFCQHGQIKLLQLLEPQTPSSLWSTKFLLTDPCHFRSSLHYLHQKFLITLVISSQRELEILKQLIVYVGIAWATAFIRNSFPAVDNSFSFQPANLLASFVLTSLKVFFLFLPTEDGRPKYFSCCRIT